MFIWRDFGSERYFGDEDTDWLETEEYKNVGPYHFAAVDYAEVLREVCDADRSASG